MKNLGQIPLLAAGLLLATASGSKALLIHGETVAENHRFVFGYPSGPLPNLSPQFVGAGLDLSGVGWSANSSQSVTMIDDRHFVYAAHYEPVGNLLNFYSPIQAAVVSYEIDIAWSVTLEAPTSSLNLASDLAVGRLVGPLDPADEIDFYPVLALPAEADYPGLDLLVYGWQAKLGRDTFDAFQPINLYWDAGTPLDPADDVLNSGSGSDTIPETYAFRFVQGAGDGEVLIQHGDSGSPTFALWNGQLALVGVHSAVSANVSYDVFLPAYLDQIAATGAAVATVPEPGTAGAVVAGLVFLSGRRRCGVAARSFSIADL